MSKGHEDQRGGKKKAKFSLKEKRANKKEKKNRDHNTPHDLGAPQSDATI